MAGQLGKLTLKVMKAYWWQVMLLCIAVLGVALTVVLQGSIQSVVASLGGLVAALGIAHQGVSKARDGLMRQVARGLWEDELELAIGEAITKLPKQDGARRQVARIHPSGPEPAGPRADDKSDGHD